MTEPLHQWSATASSHQEADGVRCCRARARAQIGIAAGRL